MKKNKPRKMIGGVPVWCVFDRVVKAADLKPNPDNPNVHPPEQIAALAKLIKTHGWRGAITVSNRSGLVVRGHGRLQAAILGGFKSVPVDFQDYDSEVDEVLDLVADNKIAELSHVDDDMVQALLAGLDQINLDQELAGMIKEDPGPGPGPGGGGEKPEVEFTQELTEAHNYIVLLFDNDMDWLQAQTVFQLQTVKSLGSKPGFEMRGIGRVINGALALNRIMGDL